MNCTETINFPVLTEHSMFEEKFSISHSTKLPFNAYRN